MGLLIKKTDNDLTEFGRLIDDENFASMILSIEKDYQKKEKKEKAEKEKIKTQEEKKEI